MYNAKSRNISVSNNLHLTTWYCLTLKDIMHVKPGRDKHKQRNPPKRVM